MAAKYSVVYDDYHVECATRHLLESSQINIDITIDKDTVLPKDSTSMLDRWACKRVLKRDLIQNPKIKLTVVGYSPMQPKE